jgi:outer membrane protein OmpA-like peptidoglycan-associated protein
MSFSKIRGSLFAGTILAAAGMASAAQAACADLVAAFDRAVAARSVDAASQAIGAIGADVICMARIDEFRARFADFLIAHAGTPGVSAADRVKAIGAAERALNNSGHWQAIEKLADYFQRNGENAKAHRWYERTISVLNTPGAMPEPDGRQLQALADKLFGTEALLNDDKEGRRDIAFVGSSREPDGRLGGLYSPALRAAVAVKVPIPINFYTNETRFTPVGVKAMELLVEAGKRERTMMLVGHADPRGRPEYNLDLSRRRVIAVRDELVRRGVAAEIRTDAKGASQPFDARVLPNFDQLTQEDIWQLDRRVELLRDSRP